MPMTPWSLIALFLVVVFLVTLIQVGVITIAFEKLGLSPQAGLTLVLGSLFGSAINIPVYRRAHAPGGFDLTELLDPRVWQLPPSPRGATLIAVNVGGCIIPVAVSLYLLVHHALSAATTLLAIAIVSTVSYRFSRLIPGIGIGMPLFLAPLVSALTSLLLDPAHSAPLAYISGTLGVLIGADLLHLRDLSASQVRLASVGGAGTFDGIFITGIVAALLA
jgi:uncharacterized membrane protein